MAKQFLRKDNVTMLWEVVNDESIFKYLPPDQQRSVHQTFLSNLEGFCEAEVRAAAGGPNSVSVLDMNKKYIMLLLNHVRTLKTPNRIRIQQPPPSTQQQLPQQQQQQMPPDNSVLTEQVHQQRKQKMDLDYLRAKQNFDDLVQVKAPTPPQFQDDVQSLTPIGSTDLEAYARQRDQEIQQLFSGPPPSSSTSSNSSSSSSSSAPYQDWLTPTETSIKAEKKTVSFSDPPPLKLKPKAATTTTATSSLDTEEPFTVQYDVYDAPLPNLQLTFEEKDQQLSNQFVPTTTHQTEQPTTSADPVVALLMELRNDIRTLQTQVTAVQNTLARFTSAPPPPL